MPLISASWFRIAGFTEGSSDLHGPGLASVVKEYHIIEMHGGLGGTTLNICADVILNSR